MVRDGEETRQRILLAAAQVFAEKGFARTTTRALADAARVSEITLFRHFGSKQGIFSAIIESYTAPALNRAIASRLSGNYRSDLLIMGTHMLYAVRGRTFPIDTAAQAFWDMFFAYTISEWPMDEPLDPPLSTEKLVEQFDE